MRKAILLAIAIIVLFIAVFISTTVYNLLNSNNKDCTVYYSKDGIGMTAVPPGCSEKDVRYVSR
jgi:hypothetical protein